MTKLRGTQRVLIAMSGVLWHLGMDEEIEGVKGLTDIRSIGEQLIELGHAEPLEPEEVYRSVNVQEYTDAFREFVAGKDIAAFKKPIGVGSIYVALGDYKPDSTIEIALRNIVSIVGNRGILLLRKGAKRMGNIDHSTELYGLPPWTLHVYTNKCGFDVGLRKATKTVYEYVKERWKSGY